MADPQEVVAAAVEDLVGRGVEQGLQVAAYHRGRMIVDVWAGVADPSRGQPMTGETLMTVFSVTKGVVATALHLLAERGQIVYDRPIAVYWPEFAAAGKGQVTVRQALSHLSAIPQMPDGITPDDLRDWDRLCAEVAALPPLWEPGTATGYHSLTFGWIIGGLIERVSGRPVAEVVRSDLFAPLGVADDFILGLPASDNGRLAPLERGDSLLGAPPPIPGSYMDRAVPSVMSPLGEVFNLPSVRRAVVPGAGGVTNARALARLYAALVSEVDGVKLLAASRVAQMTALQTDAVDLVLGRSIRKGLGYFLGDAESAMGDRVTAFGHPGHGGSIAFADPEHEFAFALTKNRLHDGDIPQVASAIIARVTRDAVGIPSAR